MSTPLALLQARLAYTFRNPSLLECALTHTSFLQEHPEVAESNQRLEFLGDAVLQLALTRALFETFPTDREGTLSKRRAALTKGEFLAQLARDLGIDAVLRLSSSEEATGGRHRAAALEDAFEAVIGSIYRDSDFTTAERVVLGIYGPLADRLGNWEEKENPKGRLQEYAQPLYGNTAVRYELLAVRGEEHARQFDCAVFLLERQIGAGTGTSKKQAEEMAARQALDRLASEGKL